MSAAAKIIVSLIFVLAALLETASRSANVPLAITAGPGLIVNEEGRWVAVSKGIEYRVIALQRGESNQPMELKLLRFDTRQVVPRVLRSAQFESRSATAQTFVQKSGALAAINANYFDEQGKPLAFLKAAGQAVNPRVSASSIYSGIFGIKEQRPLISRRDGFSPDSVDEGVQTGPLLLFDGAPQSMAGIPNRASRRNRAVRSGRPRQSPGAA